jgi:signal transduction histidine kinase
MERFDDDVSRITNAVDRMRRLLDELLDLSRVGRVEDPKTTVDMAAVAREAVEIVAGRIERAGATVDVDPDMPPACGVPARLREVFQNLLDNAAKFLGDAEHPRIEVGCRTTDSRTVYYVKDNGIGVDPRYVDKIFNLFDKLDASSEGTGVGLSMVKRIVEDLHGGDIWYEANPGGSGSVFCFTIGSDGDSDETDDEHVDGEA